MRVILIALVLLAGCLDADSGENSSSNSGTNTSSATGGGQVTLEAADAEPYPEPVDVEPSPDPRPPERLLDSNGTIAGDAHTSTPAGSAGLFGVSTSVDHIVELASAVRLELNLSWASTGPADLNLYVTAPDGTSHDVVEGNLTDPDSPITLVIDSPADGPWDVAIRSSGVAVEVKFNANATAYYQ